MAIRWVDGNVCTDPAPPPIHPPLLGTGFYSPCKSRIYVDSVLIDAVLVSIDLSLGIGLITKMPFNTHPPKTFLRVLGFVGG